MDRSQSTRDAIHDGVITAQVRHALHEHPATADFDIHVETLAHVVELSGFVETATIRDEALALAREVEGVEQVKDAIDVRRLDRT